MPAGVFMNEQVGSERSFAFVAVPLFRGAPFSRNKESAARRVRGYLARAHAVRMPMVEDEKKPSASFRTKSLSRLRAKKRASIHVAVVADLAAAAAAAAARKAAREDGGAEGGDPKLKSKRLLALKRAKQREPEESAFERDLRAKAELEAARIRAREDGGGNGGDEHARQLRREAQARLKQQKADLEAEQSCGRPAARIAIVGAGPAGLWLAVLIARKHSTLVYGANGPRIVRNSNAPTIDIFEARRPFGGDGDGGAKAHGERQVVLAITQATEGLLNRNLVGVSAAHCGTHAFAPTSRIGELERLLAAEFERYAAAGFGKLQYGTPLDNPDELHEASRGAYDVVCVGSGRRGAPDAWRAERGMESIVEGTSMALILEFSGARTSSDHRLEAGVSRAISPAQVFLRPGEKEGCGWAWLVGLPAPLMEAIRRGLERAGRGKQQHPSLSAALSATLALARGSADGGGGGGGGVGGGGSISSVGGSGSIGDSVGDDHGGSHDHDGVGVGVGIGGSDDGAASTSLPGEIAAIEGLRLLDNSLRADSAAAGCAEGSYWRSTSVIHAPAGARGPTLLIGDASCGRPFWLGSTLNGHISDLVTLANAPCWSAWDWQADGEAPLRPYLERTRLRTQRKKNAAASLTHAASASAMAAAATAQSGDS